MSETTQRCRHFTGVSNSARCEAGVEYEAVRKRHASMEYVRRGVTYRTASSLPCLSGCHNLGGAECHAQSFYTPEEVAAQREDTRRFIEQMGTARRAITEATGNAGGSGTVPCPACGGSLRYSQAATNKHVHARCATEGCLAWME